jgi:hypothetical protein
MVWVTGFQLQPSHGSAVRNEASNSNATTPNRIRPRLERAEAFRPTTMRRGRSSHTGPRCAAGVCPPQSPQRARLTHNQFSLAR